jgi:hypothetical protein
MYKSFLNSTVLENDEYSLPNAPGLAGQVLKYPNAGTELEWGSTASGGGSGDLTSPATSAANIVVAFQSGDRVSTINTGLDYTDIVTKNGVDTLSNKTIGATNDVTSSSLKSATSVIDVSSSAEPTASQVLMATDGANASWQNLPASGSGDMLSPATSSANHVTAFLNADTVTTIDTGLNYNDIATKDGVETLTNKTIGATNDVTSSSLKSATSVIDVSSSAEPTTSQVLMAIDGSNASWQNLPSGSGDLTSPATSAANIVVAFLNADKTSTINTGLDYNDIATKDGVETLTNKTIGSTNDVTSSSLKTTGASVDVSASAPPTSGQVLRATSATTSQWATLATGSGDMLSPATSSANHVTAFLNTDTVTTIDTGLDYNDIATKDGIETLTNKTIGSTNDVTSSSLKSATSVIDVSSSAEPVSGRVLMATSGVSASWQDLPASGSGDLTSPFTSAANKVVAFLNADKKSTINTGLDYNDIATKDGVETLTNKTIGSTNDVTSSSLKSATSVIDVSSSAEPTASQVLMASDGTNASWQDLPASGSGDMLGPFTSSANHVTAFLNADTITTIDTGLDYNDIATKDGVETLTNKTIGATNDVTSSSLKSATSVIDVSSSAEPTTSQVLMAVDGSNATWQDLPSSGGSTAAVLPAMTGAQSVTEIAKYINEIKQPNSEGAVVTYVHGQQGQINTGGYLGGVYSPTQNRIYLVPNNMGTFIKWHYWDCRTSILTQYTHGHGNIGDDAYGGGVYSPTQNRIYFVPLKRGMNADWHYVDCDDGSVVSYTSGSPNTLTNKYMGGVYSPTQNRIYFIPYAQAAQSTWEYIDCSNGNVVSYTHGATGLTSSSYFGGVYSPTQDRIYLVPFIRSSEATWHYIDCSDGSVVAYTHGATSNPRYAGGVFSPTQNRIYFVPESNGTNYQYVECSDGSIGNYTVTGTTTKYRGGIYSPTQDRIYFVPYYQGSNPWHYMDCTTGTMVQYDGVYLSSDYQGGVYSPTENRIYFVPYNISASSSWHYIQPLTAPIANMSLMASGLFNKL